MFKRNKTDLRCQLQDLHCALINKQGYYYIFHAQGPISVLRISEMYLNFIILILYIRHPYFCILYCEVGNKKKQFIYLQVIGIKLTEQVLNI